jgi:hypothetical protein
MHCEPTQQAQPKEPIMNIAKNMEVIFVAAIALIGATGLATAAAPERVPVQFVSTASVEFDGAMQVVTITAKRVGVLAKAVQAQ